MCSGNIVRALHNVQDKLRREHTLKIMNLSAQINNFLDNLKNDGHTSKLTIKNYSHYLKRFLDFANYLKSEDINLELVSKYKYFLSTYIDPKTKKHLKIVTQNYFIIAIRAFLRYLQQKNITSLDAEQVKLIEVHSRQSLKTLEDVDLKRLLEAPDIGKKDGLRDRAILETLLSTGLRVSELTSLNCETIALGIKEFSIVGKGGKKRVVTVSDSAADWLNRYLSIRKDTFKPLFIRFQGKVDLINNGENMRLSTRSIERVVDKYAKALNLSVKATPQILRHSFAVDTLDKGADIHAVQQLLGHNNVSTTQAYSHSDNISLQDFQKSYHPSN